LFNKFFRSDSSRIAYYIITYALYTAIAGSFDVAFTLRVTGSFTSLCVLYLFYYICITVAFVISTFFISTGRFSRGFRFNLVTQAAIGFLMFFLLPTKEHPFILIPYFMLKGVSEGLYWSTRHAALSCLTENEHRDRFLLSMQVGSVLVSVSMPVLAGIFMHFNSVKAGYSGIYIAAAIAALISMIAGPRIVSNAPARPDFRKFPTFLKERKTRSWRTYIFFSTINGSLALFCAGVINVGVLKTEFNLGLFTSGAALLSAVFILVVRKKIYGRNFRRITFVFSGAMGDLAGRLVYTVFLSVPALIFKAFCDSFLSPLRSIFAENIIRRKADLLAEGGGYTALEPYLFQEIYILFARVLAFSACTVIFLAFPVGPTDAARIILFVLSFAPLIDTVLVNRIEKENAAGSAADPACPPLLQATEKTCTK
jgi:hypothetical protein